MTVDAPLPPGRKIELDEQVYCRHDVETRHMRDGCDHDFEKVPTKVHWDCSEWTCTRCLGVVSYGVWQ